jgi:hypothetical protein
MLLGNIVYTKHRFTVPKISFKLLRTIISVRRHHDIQHNDTQHNDTQHKGHSAKKTLSAIKLP